MKKESAPAKKRSLPEACQSALAQIKILRLIQAPAAWVFWMLEQRIALLDIQIEKLRS